MMVRLLRRLRVNQRGSAAIELALIAPILGTFVIGISDMSNAMGRKLVLEQAAQRGIEKIMQTTTDTTVDATIVAEAAAAAGVDADQVVLDFWLECAPAGGGAPVRKASYADDDCSSTEREARYITLTVNDKYVPMFPVHFGAINADGTYHLKAVSGIRIK